MFRSLAKLSLIFLVVAAVRADEISFLRVRLSDGQLQVIEHKVAPGTLKPQPNHGGTEFELFSHDPAQGSLYRARIDLPTRLEYPLDEHGQIGSFPLQESEFVARAPYLPEARSLRLLRPRGTNGARQSQAILEAEIPPPAAVLRAQALEPQPNFHTLLTNGPSSKRLNILVFGDGFQPHEESLFTNRATALVTRFLGASPYSVYPAYFNAFAIFTPSRDSGSDIPSKGIFRDTYFNSTFESFGIERLLTIPPNNLNPSWTDGRGKVFDLIARFMPDYDIPVLLVNDTMYGGSGGVPAIASLNTSSADIAIHEIGHSFAGLGDEYDTPANYPDIEEPNTTKETRREFIKWNSWILESTPVPTPATAAYSRVVGLFEGAHYNPKGWYRPKLNCMMRSLGVPFCEVCSEALVLACYSRLDLIQSAEPGARRVTTSVEEPLRFKFELLPGSETLQFEWRLNGSVLPVETTELDLADFYLGAGEAQVALHAREVTPLVRTDRSGHLAKSQTWTVQVLSSRTPELTGRVEGSAVRFESSMPARLVIESSWDFESWTPLLTNAAQQVEVPIAGGSGSFYRAVAWPLF